MDNQYTPEYLKKWTHPDNYYGETWDEYYVCLFRHRDSSIMDRHNFDYAYKMIMKVHDGKTENDFPLPQIVRESHFLVGWVEWIAIHEEDKKSLQLADELVEEINHYHVLDGISYMEKVCDEAKKVWTELYSTKDRIRHIRQNGHYCSEFSELLATVRGKLIMVEPDSLVY